LRAPRANRVFYTDEKRIRIEDTVLNMDSNWENNNSDAI